MAKTINFMNQLTEHVVWSVRLRCFLDGGEYISEEQAVSCEKYILSKWLYQEGMKKYAHLPQVNELEKIYCQMHWQVKQIIHDKNENNNAMAESGLSQLYKINKQIVKLLTKLEKKFNPEAE
ncbi:MAG: hypothetical protein ABIG64_03415 [Candidatus Omnitrophota bacterium]